MTKKSALLLIAPTGYQDVELDGTRQALQSAGFTVELASTEVGACAGKFGGSEQAGVAVRDVRLEDYDRVGIIGGPGAAALRAHPEVLSLVRRCAEAGMPLGAICIAPTILAAAGVLQGVHATVWNDDGAQEALLAAGGATYTGQAVTVDGRIATANGPAAAQAFGEALAAL